MERTNTNVSTSQPPTTSIFEEYARQRLADSGERAYDELVSESGETRSHSKPFIEAINQLGAAEFSQRWEQAQRLVHENGVAYSAYASHNARTRPWELDALPLLLPSSEWKMISAALQQRAILLNLVLRDLYGEQSLLRKGILPPDLLFSHPGFMRPFHGQRLRRDCYLHFYAADLGRASDGRWWVMADRTEAPSGLGYALENRVVVSRMLPDLYQQLHVERLAPFFIAAQEALRDLAPGNRENPRVVLLSDGPNSPNYFEDAYLARYMGYTLVEGGDLAVRNEKVMLKTLGGLLPVEVIFRRQNSSVCDPLELDSRSRKGIASLTHAARLGSVTIANGLGSGLVESTAFMALMPALCRELLGEDLQMPSVATWWCGQADSLNYVLSNLDRLAICPAFRRRGSDGPTHESLSTMPKDQLAERIRANPIAFAAQEKVRRSTVPTWGEPLKSARLALRAHLVAADDSYLVMQGALARLSTSFDTLDASIRKGERSKDVWILSDVPVKHVSLLEERGRYVTLRRSGAELPSRAADNIFWLGRQLERAEASARLIRSTASRLTGETRAASDVEVPVLLRCLADQGQIQPDYAIDNMRHRLPPLEQALPNSVFDSSEPACLRRVLDEIFRLGSIVRDRMSLDTWRIIRRIDEGFQPAKRGPTSLADLQVMTDELITELNAFSGIVMESMTRTQAFRFLDLGRRLERSLQVMSLVKNSLSPMPEFHGPVLETVLEVADSFMTYRSRYMANLQLAAVLDLLLTDETNPRSLAYQFVSLEDHVEKLPRDNTQPGLSAEQRHAMSLLHSLRMIDIRDVADKHSLGEYDVLENLCENWETKLPRLAEAISHRYLFHAVPARRLSDISPQ